MYPQERVGGLDYIGVCTHVLAYAIMGRSSASVFRFIQAGSQGRGLTNGDPYTFRKLYG